MRAPKWLLWLVGPLVGMSRDFVNHSVGLPGPEFSSAKAQKELGLTFIDFQVSCVLCVWVWGGGIFREQGGEGSIHPQRSKKRGGKGSREAAAVASDLDHILPYPLPLAPTIMSRLTDQRV